MIRTFVFAVMTALSTLVFSLIGVIGGLFRAGHGLFDWIHRSWAGLMLRIGGIRLEVEGLENLEPGRGQILVANHQSMLDIWVLMAGVPVSLRFVAKAELSKIPIFARACRVAGHVFIDRKDAAQARAAIRAAGDRLRAEGLTLVLFPEGTRSLDGRVGRFRRGSFGLAIESQAPLVPVAIDGTGGILPKGSKTLRPGLVRIRIAPAIPLEGMTIDDRDPLMDRTHDTIVGLLASGD